MGRGLCPQAPDSHRVGREGRAQGRLVPACSGWSGATAATYFILKSMEVGTSFRAAMPKYPTADPDYRILSRQRSRYTHYYFYIRDSELGPIALCVGSFLPFSITYYLNGHHFIEQQLRSAGIEFRKNDNAFLWVADAQALQAAADALSAKLIRARSITGP